MIERLKAGRHPDTDEGFWNDWEEPPAPVLYAVLTDGTQKRYWRIGGSMSGVLLLSLWMMRARRRKKSGQ